jgi:hypothetical protein
LTTEELAEAAAFLEEFALHAPRPKQHHPPADTPQWREIQGKLRDLAGRFRKAAGGDSRVEFHEQDAVFLDDQSNRMYRMHYWIRKQPNLGLHDIRTAETAGISAGRFKAIVEHVREFVQVS